MIDGTELLRYVTRVFILGRPRPNVRSIFSLYYSKWRELLLLADRTVATVERLVPRKRVMIYCRKLDLRTAQQRQIRVLLVRNMHAL
jgi:hypothetical protein